MPILGVNIDHVATLRQARRDEDPDPILAAKLCEQAGAKSIVAHLREDRRHIQERDILVLKRTVKGRFNLEMSIHPEIVKLACSLRPHQVTLVPERRAELTTEGGLDVVKYRKKMAPVLKSLHDNRMDVSLFIAPSKDQVLASLDLGVKAIEIHTGHYALAFVERKADIHFQRIVKAADLAHRKGLIVNMGHGLNYHNVRPIAKIAHVHELNIGHAIISRAVFVGLSKAVKEMVDLIT